MLTLNDDPLLSLFFVQFFSQIGINQNILFLEAR